jgi:hypothetical protein
VSQPTAGSQPDPLPIMQQPRQHSSRLVLLNPGREPAPVPEDWKLPDLLELIHPNGRILICDEPGGAAIGELQPRDPALSASAGPVIEAVAAGVYNPGQPPVLLTAAGYVAEQKLWRRVAPGGFLCIHAARPEDRHSDAQIDLRQRLVDWLESIPADGRAN